MSLIVTLLASFFLSSLPSFADLDRVEPASVNLPSYEPKEGFSLEDAVDFTFDRPVGIYSPPGDSQRVFILELSGRIMLIPNMNEPTKEVFLDLRGSTRYASANIEQGLMGLAFHPEFQENGQFFVFRTQTLEDSNGTRAMHQVVSRFSVMADNANRGDPLSEVIVLKQLDGSTQHSGGDLKFGPDGYLYISTGDLVPTAVDASPNPQAIDRGHFGGILRIDVDKKAGNLAPNPHHSVTDQYLIPADNPFIGLTEFQGQSLDPDRLRTEFYAIGFRNPWKMAFNPADDSLIVADVGGANFEEVALVKPGENHGWPYIQGTETGISPPAGFVGTLPLVAYSHDLSDIYEGLCVIGGLFYEGDKYPGLQGAYLYGDYVTGHVWHLFPEDDGVVRRPTGWIAYFQRVTSFGIDPSDDSILLSSFETGKIKRLVHHTSESAPPFPQTLTETGLFSDLSTLTANPGVVPYEINHTFWSDHATKTRWFGISNPDAQFTFHETDPWNAPTSAFWVKHFDLPLSESDLNTVRRLETRVIVKQDTGAYGVTYRWNDEQTEAFLVETKGETASYEYEKIDGTIEFRDWVYPARGECMRCHNQSTTRALGFNTPQLNRTMDYGSGESDQLEALFNAGYLSSLTTKEQLDRFVETHEEEEGLIHRAKSYLSTNCSFCHNPGDVKNWDARSHTPLLSMGVYNRLLLPNRSSVSWLYVRPNRRNKQKMPPIGSTSVDHEGVGVIARWIDSFPKDGWTEEIGQPSHPWAGASREASGKTFVSGNGDGLVASGRILSSLEHSLLGTNSLFRARLLSQSADSMSGRAGLIVQPQAAMSRPCFQSVNLASFRLNIRRVRQPPSKKSSIRRLPMVL